jgi:archaemetzincin
MQPTTITFVSLGLPDRDFVEQAMQAAAREYACAVVLKEVHLDISDYYDPVRRQYNADKLLRVIDGLDFPGSDKTIGLFNVDLFIPILTYIFGQAQLGGRTGIASMYRLSNERYGIAGNGDLLSRRFTKEIIHELGHLFGLIHCHTPGCVMQSSTYVEDIDQKEAHLCAKCSAALAVG